MTGYGDARDQNDRLGVVIEVRTVNNRYLKVSVRCPDSYSSLENKVEKLVREFISRGTVTVSIRVHSMDRNRGYQLDRDVLQTYWEQIGQASAELGVGNPPDIASLLMLPGSVLEMDPGSVNSERDWPFIRDVLETALQKLGEFRAEEGRSMREELRQNCQTVADQLQKVAAIAPQVVIDYRDRVLERVRELLSECDSTIDGAELIREVSIFAERCDINEEITRLRCHLDQFDAFLAEETPQGRKLDFLTQEMFREINTIGSKANNVLIAHNVVEMKAASEKIREILQNVE